MSVPVVAYSFTPINAEDEKLLYCLRRQAGSQRLSTEDDVAKEVEEASTLTKGDVKHVMNIFMSELRKILVRGDRVKITGLGTFYMTISSESEETLEALSVRNIKRVNIRFLPDKALKLVNNALAGTRSDNNVSFVIKDATVAEGANEDDDDDEEYIDPEA